MFFRTCQRFDFYRIRGWDREKRMWEENKGKEKGKEEAETKVPEGEDENEEDDFSNSKWTI